MNAQATADMPPVNMLAACIPCLMESDQRAVPKVMAPTSSSSVGAGHRARPRPHQGIQSIPDPYHEIAKPPPDKGELISIPILGGLHHDNRRVA